MLSGSEIVTFTGKFDPLNPRVEEASPVDVAWALSNQCRWTGHTRAFYSVAQHCTIAAEVCLGTNLKVLPDGVDPERAARTMLMHDAAEAYLVDLARPVKAAIGAAYVEVENRIMEVLLEATNGAFDWPLPPWAHELDSRMLFTEKRDLIDAHRPSPTVFGWSAEAFPHIEITPQVPDVARESFRRMAWKLGLFRLDRGLERWT